MESLDIPLEFSPGELIEEHLLLQFLGTCGRGVKAYRGCRLVRAERIRIGDYSQIDEAVWILGGEGVSIGRHVHFAIGSSILGGGSCTVHDFASIGAGVRLVTGTELVDGQALTNPTVPPELRQVRRGKIEIGAHALIFTNSVVLPDVTVGDGTVVAAGSLVHRSLNAWGIYAGNPLVQVGVRPKETILRLAGQMEAS